jgi:hypothetical protein
MLTRSEHSTSLQRRIVLGCCVILGLAMGVLIGGNSTIVAGVVTAAIVIGYGVAVTLLGSRSETAKLLSGGESDERQALIQLKAAAFTGIVLVVVVLGGALVELAQGENDGPFVWLGAAGGATYVLASAYLSRRN